MRRAGLVRATSGCLLATVLGGVSAQVNPLTLHDCVKTSAADARLQCFDRFAAQELEKARKAREEERLAAVREAEKFVRWKVRDTGTISASAEADIGSKPGLFQVGRSDGRSFSTAKVAAIASFAPIHRPGSVFDTWEPFVGLSWERDTSAKTPKDLRQIFAGITGNLLMTKGDGTALLATARLGHREEIKKHSDGNFANLHVDVVHLPWVNADQTDTTNSLTPIPFFGTLWERSRSSPPAAEDGRRLGMYAGIKSAFQLHAIAPRLSGTASAQWFRDARVSDGLAKRHERYLDVGLTYHLVDPKTSTGWVPSISLSRQLGVEPVTGQGPDRKTVLGLGLKLN